MINNTTYKALLNSSGVVVAVFNKFKAFGSSICSIPSLNHKNGNTISRSPLAGLISGWGSLSLILICDRACTRSPVPSFWNYLNSYQGYSKYDKVWNRISKRKINFLQVEDPWRIDVFLGPDSNLQQLPKVLGQPIRKNLRFKPMFNHFLFWKLSKNISNCTYTY